MSSPLDDLPTTPVDRESLKKKIEVQTIKRLLAKSGREHLIQQVIEYNSAALGTPTLSFSGLSLAERTWPIDLFMFKDVYYNNIKSLFSFSSIEKSPLYKDLYSRISATAKDCYRGVVFNCAGLGTLILNNMPFLDASIPGIASVFLTPPADSKTPFPHGVRVDTLDSLAARIC